MGENDPLDDSSLRYHRVVADCIDRPPNVPVSIPLDSIGPFFNPPAVETLQWDTVLPWIAEDRRQIVRAILDRHLWDRTVLLPDVIRLRRNNFCDGHIRSAPLPPAAQEELIHVGYVLQGANVLHGCPIFAVRRPDGRLRLIWDGRSLNDICHQPPSFAFTPIHKQLETLLAPKVQGYFVFDFKSWFVQLKPTEYVGRWFGTRLHRGRGWVLSGLPMGFSWAPVIAQSTSEGILTEIQRRIAATCEFETSGFVYIDNGILAISGATDLQLALDTVETVVRQVCQEAGAVIKDGSVTKGPLVEWIGLELDASFSSYRLKPAFVEKFAGLVSATSPTGSTVRQWYSVLSSTVYAYWVTQQPLARIAPVIRWMGDLGATVETEHLSWGSLVEGPTPYTLESLTSARERIVQNAWHVLPPQFGQLPLAAVGVSDASTEARAYAFHTAGRMVAIATPAPSPDIFRSELVAMIEGMEHLLDEVPSRSSIEWHGDNSGGICCLRRGLSRRWDVNGMILRHWERRMGQGVAASIQYVPTAENLVDQLTRGVSGLRWERTACPLHPSTLCPEFVTFLSEAAAAAAK